MLSSSVFLAMLEDLSDLPFELRFELVETMALDRLEEPLASTLRQIRSCGIHLDLDDFGAANATVLGLMNIQPSHVKIDGNLVSAMTPGNIPERLVCSIIDMGHSLGIPIIAEGVNALELVDSLVGMGCDYVQGFALSPPLSIDELAMLLHKEEDRDTVGQTSL